MVQDTGLGQEMFVSVYEKQDNGHLSCYRYTDDPVHMQDDPHQVASDHLDERAIVYCVSPPGQTAWNASSSDVSEQLQRLTLSNTQQQGAHKFPLPGAPHTAAIVKFYQSLDTLRVGQMVDLLGVMGNVQQVQEDDVAQQQQSSVDDGLESPLAHLNDQPVFHAITFRPVSGSPFTHAQIDAMQHQIKDIRTPLIHHIAAYLGGDDLAAELVLLQLLSKVSTHVHDLKIGQFSLNLTNVPCDAPVAANGHAAADSSLALTNAASRALASLLQDLVLHQVSLPLTLETLNKSWFFPRSENEDLRAGLLQLVPGTHVLVDETSLTEGKLGDQGVRNMQALVKVMQQQSLPYAFPFSQFDFDTDIAFISLSTGKSLLPYDCTVPLQFKYPMDASALESHAAPSDDQLALYRMYIQACRAGAYEIPEEMSQFIQDEFVHQRKVAAENKTRLPNQEDLMARLNLCRLVTLSFGETTLTRAIYDHAMQLCLAIDQRLPAATTTTTNGTVEGQDSPEAQK
ncbi:putative alanine racemase-domain-containing protein [Gongronella butleri]|nr:putative alanine racemase-domain-containing protein [Gongronella butleri]